MCYVKVKKILECNENKVSKSDCKLRLFPNNNNNLENYIYLIDADRVFFRCHTYRIASSPAPGDSRGRVEMNIKGKSRSVANPASGDVYSNR